MHTYRLCFCKMLSPLWFPWHYNTLTSTFWYRYPNRHFFNTEGRDPYNQIFPNIIHTAPVPGSTWYVAQNL